MNLLWALFFGLGVAAFTYAKFGRRVGYGNGQSVWAIVAITFVLTTIFMYTLMAWVLHLG